MTLTVWSDDANCTMFAKAFLERNMSSYNSRYFSILLGGLVLFAFSLAISKSACNVLLFLLYPAAVFLAISDRDFKASILSNARQPMTFALALSLLVAIIGAFFTENVSDGFRGSEQALSVLAIYFLFAVLTDSVRDNDSRDRNNDRVLLAFLIGLLVLNIIAILTLLGIVGHKKFILPLSPLHVHHIWFSNINAIGLYTAASFLMFSQRTKSKSVKVFLVVFMLLAIFCILLSLSRTAWFSIVLTSMFMAFLFIKNKRIFFISAAATAIVCVAAYAFIPIIHERIGLIGSDIEKFSAGEEVTSLGRRFLMWKAAIMMFLSNPLIGVGTGGYVPTMKAYITSGQMPEFLLEFNQPHNMYLFALATNGLLGLGGLLYVFYRGLRFALPLVRTDGKEKFFAFVATATIIHFMIAGLTDSFFNIQILRYTFAFVMGVTVREISKVNA
jgi:O-antigen ligase